MKRVAAILCIIVFASCAIPPCLAQDGVDGTEYVSFRGLTVPADTAAVDLGEERIGDWDAFYAFLDRLPALERADIFATPVYSNRIKSLTERYPNVHFGMTMCIAEHTVRTDQTAFSTLHNSSSAPHTQEDFSVLRYCDRLLALDIGHNMVDDLSFLKELPELRVLIIGRNAVRDITPLSGLTDLEYLEMFTNKVTDLSPLSGLPRLKDLSIAYNRVQDFSPLYGMTNLERLWLYNANNYSDDDPVPAEVVSALRENLPDCEIDEKSGPTGGTWREHPRYFVIRKMFATGTYIPFDEED